MIFKLKAHIPNGTSKLKFCYTVVSFVPNLLGNWDTLIQNVFILAFLHVLRLLSLFYIPLLSSPLNYLYFCPSPTMTPIFSSRLSEMVEVLAGTGRNQARSLSPWAVLTDWLLPPDNVFSSSGQGLRFH